MVEGNFVSLFVHDGEKDPSDHAGMRTIQSRKPEKSSNTMKIWPKNSNKNLVPLATRTSFHQIL